MGDTADIFLSLGIGLGLGLLVGMQRQRERSAVAGVRTFALITVLGTLCGHLAGALGGWIVALALAGVVASIGIGKVGLMRREPFDPGSTTEIAAVLMFAIGVLLAVGPREVAVALGGLAAVVLHAKTPLHRLAERLGDADVRAIMQFVLISLVVLPVLPDQTYGPLDVLNPRQIWLMVVLIVGISLAAYLSFRVAGERVGTLVSGILGGLISSTATTVSSARRAASAPGAVSGAATVIVLASAVMYVRVLVEVAVVAPRRLLDVVPPIAFMLAVVVGLAGVAWWRGRREAGRPEAPGNPTQLRSALFFGAMYAIVLLAVAAAREWLGTRGIYAVSALSGLSDMDAITLSSARLLNEGRIEAGTAWRSILVGAMGNTAFKAGVVAMLGGPSLLLRLVPYFAITIAAGLAAVLWWP